MTRAISILTMFVLAVPNVVLAGSSIFSVPGVPNSGSFVTLFACANHDSEPSQVGVECFDAAGASLGNTTLIIPSNGSILISTGNVATHTATSMGLGSFEGSAKVSVNGKATVCTAYVQSPSSSVSYMNGLPMFRRAKQK